MALKAVFFDVGETLVNEERYWRELAALLELPPHVVWAALGVTIARSEHHRRLFDHLGVEPPDVPIVYRSEDFYADALDCLAACRRAGLRVGVAGNQSQELEEWFRAQDVDVDWIASSARWGVEKPSPEFFARIVAEAGCAPEQIAYVGDRIDNDVLPAKAAGLFAVHIRRGPWGNLQRGAEAADLRLGSLAKLPEALPS